MVSGPELVRMTTEFEASLETKHKKSQETRHHEQTKSVQVSFGQHVTNLVRVMEEMGNPFLEETTELRLDTRDFMASVQVSSL